MRRSIERQNQRTPASHANQAWWSGAIHSPRTGDRVRANVGRKHFHATHWNAVLCRNRLKDVINFEIVN